MDDHGFKNQHKMRLAQWNVPVHYHRCRWVRIGDYPVSRFHDDGLRMAQPGSDCVRRDWEHVPGLCDSVGVRAEGTAEVRAHP